MKIYVPLIWICPRTIHLLPACAFYSSLFLSFFRRFVIWESLKTEFIQINANSIPLLDDAKKGACWTESNAVEFWIRDFKWKLESPTFWNFSSGIFRRVYYWLSKTNFQTAERLLTAWKLSQNNLLLPCATSLRDVCHSSCFSFYFSQCACSLGTHQRKWRNHNPSLAGSGWT